MKTSRHEKKPFMCAVPLCFRKATCGTLCGQCQYAYDEGKRAYAANLSQGAKYILTVFNHKPEERDYAKTIRGFTSDEA